MEHDPFVAGSGERDDRIKARRSRIELRNATKNEEGTKNKRDAPTKEELSLGKQQVATSLVNLDKRKVKTIENVTSIRVEADHSENVRRIEEEEKRQNRLHSLQEEAVSSGKQNAAVEMRWAELMEQNMPQELMKEMEEQLSACNAINRSKDKLIKRFRDELKIKDEQYVRSLKTQHDDIEELLKRMENQYKELQEHYEVELEAIELAFLEERKQTLEKNKDDLDGLFEKRRSMEIHYMEAKQEREEKYRQELNELRTKDAEDYNQLKIKLETDIQTLEQQLEEMRATYQLNTEKLEYNYRVLTERDMENSATLGQQKRKLTRLKDALSSLMSKYHQSDTKYKQNNMELTEEYRRITKQYKDLQAKFKHFEVTDNRKYQEVWDMHEEDVFDLVKRLLQADKIIHTQQLGLDWRPPDRSVFHCNIKGLSSGKYIPDFNQNSSKKQNSKEEKLDNEPPPIPSSVNEGEEQKDNNAIDAKSTFTQRSKVSNAKVKLMLDMLVSEAEFLVDPKLQEEIDDLGSQDTSVLRADSILKALGVEDDESIQKLMSFFFDKVDDDEEDAFALELAKDEEERVQSLGLKITEDDVIRVIKAFVEERNKSDTDGLEKKGKDTSKKNLKPAEQEEKLAQAKKERERIEETEYWKRLSASIPDRTVRIWGGLEKSLLKYNKTLSERSELINDVSILQAQNKELKAVIKQYLGAKVVEDLLVPPTHVINVAKQPLYRN